MKKIGLCLSGGGAKGAFQWGALSYLKSQGLQFSMVSGVSVGALNGAMVAMDRIEELDDIWGTISNEKVYTGGINLHGLVRIFFGKNSFYSNDPLKELLDKYIHADQFKIPYFCGLVDLITGDYSTIRVSKMHRSEWVRSAILASSSIPVAFEPRQFINWSLGTSSSYTVDGGVRNNTPLADTIQSGLVDEIIVILTNPTEMFDAVPASQLKTIDQILLRSIDIMSHEIYLSDLSGALQLNDLVKQAEERGFTLTNKSGCPYHYVPIHVIEPGQMMPGTLDFSPAAVQASASHGREQAKEVLQKNFSGLAKMC